MSFSEFIKSNFYTEKSLLSATKLVAWKRNNNAYNFTELPEIAIVSVINNLSIPEKIFKKKLKGISGTQYVLNKKLLFCSSFGIGAPAVIALLEELVALGVKNFVFVGFAGRLSTKINEGEACIVSEAFSISGTSYFYEKEPFFTYKNEFSNYLKQTFSLSEKIVLSTDAPFRETPSIIESYKNKKADLLDMETAAVLAFSKYYMLDVACVLIASDAIKTHWTPPQNLELINNSAKNIINLFIKNWNE